MDNLTHTLVGALAGEAVARWTRPTPGGLPPATRRAVLVTLGAAGSNLPDIDLLWTLQAITGDPLDYLVHHRGHTHTLLGCLLLAVMLHALALAWLRWRGHAVAPADRRAIGGTAALAVFLHLGMDFLNNYGIHPFWPLHNGWVYGDAAFIIEPLFWMAAVPLVFLLQHRWSRAVAALAAMGGLALALYLNRDNLGYLVALPLLLAGLAWLASRLPPPQAVLLGLASVLLLTGGLVAHSQHIHREITRAIAPWGPAVVVHDIVRTPDPTQPRCGTALLVLQEGADYLVRRLRYGMQSPGRACAGLPGDGNAGTARWTALDLPDSARLRWQDEYRVPLAELQAALAGDCRAAQAMAFLRVPFLGEHAGQGLLGDLRFDRESGAGFTEIPLQHTPGEGCVAAASPLAPWTAPRNALLAP